MKLNIAEIARVAYSVLRAYKESQGVQRKGDSGIIIEPLTLPAWEELDMHARDVEIGKVRDLLLSQIRPVDAAPTEAALFVAVVESLR